MKNRINKEKTLTAIDGSIKKWKGIVYNHKIDHGPSDCPLCKMFKDTIVRNEYDTEIICEFCPISERTTREGCYGSPYVTYRNLIDGVFEAKKNDIQTAATQMLVFLYSIRLEYIVNNFN